MKYEDNFFVLTNKLNYNNGLFLFFFIWDDDEKWLKFVYFYAFVDDGKLWSVQDVYQADQVENFDPYFKAWIYFISNEVPKMENFHRREFLNAKLKKLKICKNLALVPESFLKYYQNFLKSEKQYFEKLVESGNNTLEDSVSSNISINHELEFDFKDFENNFEYLKLYPMFSDFHDLIRLSEQIDIHSVKNEVSCPTYFIYKSLNNLQNITKTQDSNYTAPTNSTNKENEPTKTKRKVVDNDRVQTFHWLGTDEELIWLYNEYINADFIVCERSTFIKAFSNVVLKIDEFLNILITAPARNKSNNKALIFYSLLRAEELGLIEKTNVKVSKDYFNLKMLRLFSMNGVDPLDEKGIRTTKSYVKKLMRKREKPENGDKVDKIFTDLIAMRSSKIGS